MTTRTKIREISTDLLPVYAAIPISFQVDSVLRVEVIERGLGGFLLVEEPVHRLYTKDYDQQATEGERVIDWPTRCRGLPRSRALTPKRTKLAY